MCGHMLFSHHWTHIPPSIPLIIYGTVTGASVLQLLLGGILPGLLCTVMLMLTAAWLAKKRNYPRAERWPSLKEFCSDMWPALPALAAPLLLTVGMLGDGSHQQKWLL